MGRTDVIDLDRIARPSGALAMVAIDQRESLRTMFQEACGRDISDQFVTDFKVAVARVLAPDASAMLFDRQFAMPAFEAAGLVAPRTGRIIAGDRLDQERGGPVTETDIDFEVDPVAAREQGAVALKLLVLWRGNENAERCLSLTSTFMKRCRAAGIIGIVETMVRPPLAGAEGWDREASILQAAQALGASRPDLYKCDVPYRGRVSAIEISRASEHISEALPCPWVVLSGGTDLADFPGAVAAACQGGASGFLAGRAIWADTIAWTGYERNLELVASPRLRRLCDVVDKLARPWRAVRSDSAHPTEGPVAR